MKPKKNQMEEKSMKRITAVFAMVLILSLGSVTVFAHGHGGHGGHGGHNQGGCQGRNYVDADGDGVCDNRGSLVCNAGSGCACQNGSGYTDANGDGICDNSRYSIKYKLNGGKNNKKNPSCYYNGKNLKLKNPTRKNYTFKGWYTDKNFKNKVTAIKKGSVGKKTLYAKWQKK